MPRNVSGMFRVCPKMLEKLDGCGICPYKSVFRLAVGMGPHLYGEHFRGENFAIQRVDRN